MTLRERQVMGFFPPLKMNSLTLCDPWTVAHQAPLSREFSRQEYWSGQPFPSPGDLPNPGIEPRAPALQADSLPIEPSGKPQRVIWSRIIKKVLWRRLAEGMDYR